MDKKPATKKPEANQPDSNISSILKEPAGVPMARKEIDDAIEKIKSKVKIDVGQLENKKELGGISAHNDKTKIYTANFKGKPEVIVLKETAISPYKWTTFDSYPVELAEDIKKAVSEIPKELETVSKLNSDCIAQIKGMYIFRDIDPQMATMGKPEEKFYQKLKEAQRSGHNSFIDQRCICWFVGIALKLYDGGDLVNYAFKENPNLGVKLHIIRDAAEGLNALHQANIVHRDFKPEQIFVSKNPDAKGRRAVVADFGLAKYIPDNSTPIDEATTSSPLYSNQVTHAIGTKVYQPAEQYDSKTLMKNGIKIDFKKCDVWAFGFIIWVLFVKQTDFEDYIKLGGYGGSGIAPKFDKCASDIPKEVKNIMMKCFSASKFDCSLHNIKEPEDRPDMVSVVTVMNKEVSALVKK